VTDVELVTRTAQPAIAVRRVVPMADLDLVAMVPDAYGRLGVALAEHGLTMAGAPYARYAEFGPERADVELGFPVTSADGIPPLAADDQIGATELPGGEAATYRHVGPYQDLGQAYAAGEQWFAASGRAPSGPPWESYEVGPDAVSDPSSLETLVCWPLA
jgi:effector-binding domain-containing protein